MIDGIPWRIYEVSYPAADRRRGASLIFQSEAVIRRVRDYPARWREMSDAELVRLSWRA